MSETRFEIEPELSPHRETVEGPVLTALTHGQVRVAGQPVDYTVETNQDCDTNFLAVAKPGFGGFKRTSRELRHAVVAKGLTALSYDPVRRDDRSFAERFTNPQEVHVETLEAIIDDLPESSGITVGPVEQEGVASLVIMPHSMSGLSSVEFAKRHPEIVFSLNLLAAVGCASPSLPQFFDIKPSEVVGGIRHELLPLVRNFGIRSAPRNLIRAVTYYGVNPARTIGEAASCLTEDTRDDLRMLAAAGVWLAYARMQHDILVKPCEETAEIVHIFSTLPGAGHMGPQVKEPRVADWIVENHEEFKTRQLARAAQLSSRRDHPAGRGLIRL